MFSIEGTFPTYFEQIYSWRKNGVDTPEDVDAFQKWAGEQSFTLGNLQLLKEINIQAISILTQENAAFWDNSDPDSVAIIIPAMNERGIYMLLGDIQDQASQRRERFHVYVAINGEGTQKQRSLTFQAVEKADRSKTDNVIIEPVLIDGHGKAFAQHTILERLVQEERTPGKIIFLDGDARLNGNTYNVIDTLLNLIDDGAAVSAVKVSRPEYENIDQKLAVQMHDALLAVQNSSAGMGSLQGGGYAIHASVAALYEAYTKLLPGLHAVDINWAALLRLLQIPVSVSDNASIELTTDNRSFTQLSRQHARWIMGMLEEDLFWGNESYKDTDKAEPASSPGRFYTAFMKEISKSPVLQFHVRMHILATRVMNAPFKLGPYVFGDRIQNPYVPAGWTTHR